MFNRWLAASWGQHPGRTVRHRLHSVSLSPPRLPLLLARLICATAGLRYETEMLSILYLHSELIKKCYSTCLLSRTSTRLSLEPITHQPAHEYCMPFLFLDLGFGLLFLPRKLLSSCAAPFPSLLDVAVGGAWYHRCCSCHPAAGSV